MFNQCASEDCDEPLLYVSEGFLWACWKTIYWLMFNLTIFVIPLVSSYADSGYFSAWERFKKSLRANVIYYASIGAVGLLILAWIVLKSGFRDW